MLQVQNVSKIYRMGEHEIHALRDVSLTIEQGDFVAIMGPSGSGKSTLMHLLGLLDVPTSGRYTIDGREVSKLAEEDLALLRRQKIGFIFQQFNLLPRMTAAANVALPLLYSAPGSDQEKAKNLLKQVGLENRVNHKTNELSGGQQQRVAIARSLINTPRIILADEPTGNLDSVSEKEIMTILKNLNAQGITIVIVTHEEEIGAQAKRRVRMRDGQIQVDERLEPLPKNPTKSFEEKAGRDQFFSQVLAHFTQGLSTLASNKVRTSLSMLGILIGVAAVVAMLAIGKGAQVEIEQRLSSLGSNLLVLRPGALRVGGVAQESSSTRLTTEDVLAIRDKVTEIKDASPVVQGRVQVAFGNKNWNSQVMGASPSYARLHASEPENGRFFTEDENTSRSRVAVLGATVVRELFEERSPLGEMIKINKINFQVIGVLPPKGATGFRDQDDVVVIPVQTAMRRLLGKDYVDYIELEVTAGADMDKAQDDVVDLMMSRHRIPPSQDEAFRVRNMAEIQEAMSASTKTMSLLLASIAAISLVVGGIGIMNIMLVSVTERTREVGLRKAIGGRPFDILTQFLIESIVISVVGGLAGILVGWIITESVSGFLGWSTSVSLVSVLLAFFFSASIGIVFGIYPAKRAASLNPIEALRYE